MFNDFLVNNDELYGYSYPYIVDKVISENRLMQFKKMYFAIVMNLLIWLEALMMIEILV